MCVSDMYLDASVRLRDREFNFAGGPHALRWRTPPVFGNVGQPAAGKSTDARRRFTTGNFGRPQRMCLRA